MPTAGSLAKKLLPPILTDYLRASPLSGSGWHGDYPSWKAASEAASGYDTDEIFSKVYTACKAVRDGNAVFERDSVLFDRVQYSWPALSALLLAALRNRGTLSVLDFGGSLGSSYFQNRAFLRHIDHVQWSIIEQPMFVEAGKREFQNSELAFFNDLDECLGDRSPNVLFLSSLLQYLENPVELFRSMLAKPNFDVLILDRTPFTDLGRDRITLQKVPASIYTASYPCRLFHKPDLENQITVAGFEILTWFDAVDGRFRGIDFEGCIAIRKA